MNIDRLAVTAPRQERKMKPVAFVMMLSSLAGLVLNAQEPARLAPKHYKVAAAEAPTHSVTPDGRFHLLREAGGGSDRLLVRNLATGGSRTLTEGPGTVGDAIMSPDGRLVTYAWAAPAYEFASDNRLIELRIVGIDGSRPRVIYSNRDALLFNGARLNLEFPIRVHQWSPDGKYVAATLYQEDRSRLVLFSVADASVRVLGAQGLKTLSYNSFFGKMKFSPDGRFVVYDLAPHGGSRRDIFAISAEGGSEARLVQNPANDVLLDWTPDGTGVLFASDRSGHWDLWVMPVLDGKPRGSPQMVYPNIGPFANGLGFTPDGSYYYYGVRSWENDVYFATLDPGTNKLHEITKLVTHVGFRTSTQWSRDGQYLAYAWGAGSENDPFIIGIRCIRTGKERRLRLEGLDRHSGHGFDPQWSPDGRFILADARERDYLQGQSLYRIDVETGRFTPIVQTHVLDGYNRIESPAWAPDGRVIYERRPPQRILSRDMKTGRETELYRPVPPAQVHHWPTSNLAVSPDGRSLAFVWSDEKTVDRTTALMVLPTGGGQPLELLRVQDPATVSLPAWTPDSRHLIYARTVAGENGMFEFWRITADGGEPQNLGLKMEALVPYGLSVHPDGTRIAFTAGTEVRSEVWVLKGFLPAAKQGNSRSER